MGMITTKTKRLIRSRGSFTYLVETEAKKQLVYGNREFEDEVKLYRTFFSFPAVVSPTPEFLRHGLLTIQPFISELIASNRKIYLYTCTL